MTQCDPSNVFILVLMAFGVGALLCGWYASSILKKRDASLHVLRVEIERLKAVLRDILEDPDVRILDSHRDDGWAALSKS